MKKFLTYSVLSIIWFVFSYEEVSAIETDRVIVEVGENEKVQSLSKDALDSIRKDITLDAEMEKIAPQDIKVLQPDYIRNAAIQSISSTTYRSWGTSRVGADRLKQKVSTINKNVIVAVIDTGVDYKHKDLSGRTVAGYDFVGSDPDPMDEQYHGTHVAGIIAETTPSNVKIMPLRALNEKGEGYDSAISNAIRYGVDHGAKVINLSLTGPGYSKYLADAIDYAVAKGVMVVAAAGNDKGDTTKYYPASHPKAVVVTATDQNDVIAVFSNTGSTVDLSAPGVQITSLIPGNQYATADGTSMAAPYVSAVAAMLLLEDQNRNASQVENLLKEHTDDKGPINWDPQYGAGILSFKDYDLNYVSPKAGKSTITLPDLNGVTTDQSLSIKFDRILKQADIIDVMLLKGRTEIPITVTNNYGNKEILVSPTNLFEPASSYELLIFVKGGKNYNLIIKTK